MEKLEKTRRALRLRMLGLLLLEAFAWTTVILDKRTPLGALLAEDVQSLHLGFASGLACSGMFFIVIIARTLRDDSWLKAWRIREEDERSIAIRAKAGMPMLVIAAVLMLMGGMIAGYWNEVVMKTLFLAAIVQMLLGLAAKAWYSKVM